MPIIEDHKAGGQFEADLPGGHFVTTSYMMGNIIKMMRDGYSPLIAVVGKQRIGKSTVSLMLANTINQAWGKKFILRHQVYFEPIALINSMNECDARECRILDEAINQIHRREWFKQSHVILSKLISTQSYLELCHIWNIPFKSDLDTSFLKYFDFLVHVKRWGHYKTWQFNKRHDADAGKEITKVFLDDIFYNKSDLPAAIWDEYAPWSKSEKEKLKSKYAKNRVEEVSEQTRMMRAMRGLMTKGALN
jgi:hypothetical protein